jgi:Flp pilus assembly protein TadG
VRRGRDERGTALIELTWLSILLLVPLIYLLLAVFEVQRAAYGVSAATRAAARAYSLAPSQAAAGARAREAAAVALADQGLDLSGSSLQVRCVPAPRDCLSPGSVLDVRMVVSVRLPLVPDALGAQTPSIRVQADHRVPYGPYREERP